MSITVTPQMLKAAWVEARRWWPRKVVELYPGTDRARYHVVETCILVDEPLPGFREALEAAFKEAA